MMTTKKAICGERPSRESDGFGQSGNPYEEFGSPTVITVKGTMTMLGGSILRPELEA